MKVASQCHFCKHYVVPVDTPGHKCEAYPQGIPDELFDTKRLHDAPYPGDGGIHWEARDEQAAEVWAWLLKRREWRDEHLARGEGTAESPRQ